VLSKPWCAAVAAVVTVSLLAATVLAASPAGADVAWARPVDGAVVRPFDSPEHPWGSGHRGVDLAARQGVPVRAAGDGRVAFAGSVAGALHVVIDHGDGLRTSYSFLADRVVRTGEAVERGDVVGHVGAAGAHHDEAVLHLGLRRGDEYLDPMVLFADVDLVESVRLVPVDDPIPAAAPDPRDGLVDLNYELHRDVLPSWARADDWVEQERRRRRGLFERLRDGAAGGVGWVAGRARDGLDWVAALEDRLPGVGAVGLTLDVLDGVVAWADGDCARSGPALGRPVNYHDAMFVAGVNSRTDTTGRTNGFPLEDLYADGMQHWYEYPSDGLGYDQADTHGSIDAAARALRDQLMALADDGVAEIDLVAHSQGGLVVRWFLARYYEQSRDELPIVTEVVTISSPLEGAPAAGAGRDLATSHFGGLVDEVGGVPIDAPATRDLDPDSELQRALRDTPLPDGVHWVAIGVTDDLVVPATTSDDPDGVEWVPTQVDATPFGAHSAATTDERVVRRSAAAISGRRPCASFGEHLRGAVVGNVVTDVERTVGMVLAGDPLTPTGAVSEELTR
jgi:hypothetical protein